MTVQIQKNYNNITITLQLTTDLHKNVNYLCKSLEITKIDCII